MLTGQFVGCNELRLEKARCKYDLYKYSIPNRIRNICNSLPNRIVLAESVNRFKSRLDKHWRNRDIIFCVLCFL